MPNRNCGTKEEIFKSGFSMSAFARQSDEGTLSVIRYTNSKKRNGHFTGCPY